MSKDVAQRELNQANFKISNLGAPSAASDAARLQDVQAYNKVTLSDPGAHSVVGTAEEIVAEFYASMDDAGGGLGGPQVKVRVAAIVNATDVAGSKTGTYKVYTGATNPGSTAGGTARATAATTSQTDEGQMNLGAAFANPGGSVLVQLTASHSDVAGVAQIRGISIDIG